ncbi:beta-N-acetylhexosaminidase [Polaribacter sp. Asnod1-A03]|uniref:beta-N-acetylhexosaminidase n=1 Tax=Polaribacter sp. Asnod1-A03 TaxID=3160581 RepID=UPI00386347F4
MKKIVFILFVAFFNLSLFCQNELNLKYNLMPWPQEIKENNSSFIIDENILISVLGDDKEQRVEKASVKFLRRLANRTGVFINNGFPVNDENASIKINFKSVSDLSIESDESYDLSIDKDQITINSKTDVGALRGLETLLQLVNFNDTGYYFEGVNIKDAPRFIWRGLMIDVARHFQPINVLKRNLDAMASVKLNVFHWHLTDDQGFRFESKRYPKLQELASDGLFYTQIQIKEIVKYASDLGIRVVPEFDVPGHASSILTAYPELGSKDNYDYSIERFSGVFDPTLNPTKEETYVFLENLFTEIAPLFPDKYFHIGGDENEGKHWDESKEIQDFKKQHNLKTNHDLQTYFNIRLEKILSKLDKKLMGWDEILTPSTPKTAVIHSWRGKHEGLAQSTLIEAAKKGYQSVLSNGYYIDRMLSVKEHYLVDPIADAVLTKEERKRILGAETTMWSELVTPLTIDSRIWPRTAAIAERFWSVKEINDLDDMERRLKVVNFQLEELGITHIRNRDVILRNISNHQENDALKTLSNLCEPLKVYSRNKEGTEYKTFSPFTLFADACIADAIEADAFNKLVAIKDFDAINNHLKKWSNNYTELEPIINYPNIKPLKELSKNLSITSKLLLNIITKKEINTNNIIELDALIVELKKTYADVELAVVDSFTDIIFYCKKTYLNKK